MSPRRDYQDKAVIHCMGCDRPIMPYDDIELVGDLQEAVVAKVNGEPGPNIEWYHPDCRSERTDQQLTEFA